MNLEQLCRSISENYDKLKDKKKTGILLRYQFELLAGKRRKLKLGAIVFEIKEYIEGGITLTEEVEIRYIRQDNTEEDEMKFENRLKALNGKGDFSNVMAFIIIFSIVLVFIIAFVYRGYTENLPLIAFRQEQYNKLIEFNFISTFGDLPLLHPKSFTVSNYGIAEALTNFAIQFNILF